MSGVVIMKKRAGLQGWGGIVRFAFVRARMMRFFGRARPHRPGGLFNAISTILIEKAPLGGGAFSIMADGVLLAHNNINDLGAIECAKRHSCLSLTIQFNGA